MRPRVVLLYGLQWFYLVLFFQSTRRLLFLSSEHAVWRWDGVVMAPFFFGEVLAAVALLLSAKGYLVVGSTVLSLGCCFALAGFLVLPASRCRPSGYARVAPLLSACRVVAAITPLSHVAIRCWHLFLS